MSDIRKLLNNIEQLSESSAGCSTAGSVATVAMPLGSTQKRVEEAAPEGPKVAVTPPEFASGGSNWGNWQNSVHSKFNKKSKKTKVKEAKQVDEVSKETIGSYIKKASQDLVDRATGSSFMSGKAGDKYNKSDDTPKETKRKKGLARAVDKLVKEDEPKPVTTGHFADKPGQKKPYPALKNIKTGKVRPHPADPEAKLQEGADFGAYYYEQLAQKMFDLNPNFSTKGRCDELLNAAFPIAVQDLGKKRAQWEFGYDEDFISDFVSAYGELQRGEQGVAEGLGKNIKRGMQGWYADATDINGEKMTPKDVVRRNKNYDNETLQRIHKAVNGPGPGFPFSNSKTKHSPADLQKRVLDREMKKRGLGEQGVAEEATPEQKKWHKALKKAQQARLGKKSFTTRDLARIEKLEQEAEDIRKKGVAKKVDEAKLSEDDVVAKKYKADDVVSARNSGKADVAKAVESLERIAVASDEIIGSLRTTKSIPGWVSKSIAKALDELEDIASFVTTSSGVLEGAMKDIDIGRQDCESMTATQFKKAYGMTKAEWKAKNKKVLGGK